MTYHQVLAATCRVVSGWVGWSAGWLVGRGRLAGLVLLEDASCRTDSTPTSPHATQSPDRKTLFLSGQLAARPGGAQGGRRPHLHAHGEGADVQPARSTGGRRRCCAAAWCNRASGRPAAASPQSIPAKPCPITCPTNNQPTEPGMRAAHCHVCVRAHRRRPLGGVCRVQRRVAGAAHPGLPVRRGW